ncbi:transposase [Corynebacterium striatum]|uniref:transposase n=3 Tax=Corynebacterium striatum TaxID=43770 RepID=UPI001A1F7C89|nr:transposase [Corynebacterium striatum]HAT6554341.1 transposase [Corynebacterium striatum]HAT6590645.1 transposase [Corynebacterium striatum]HAT6641508.1 transposase [Corynebacterium striatum]
MPRYSEQFKRDAVALYENNEDLSLHAASAELGVNRSSLFSWLQQYGTGKRARTKAMRDKVSDAGFGYRCSGDPVLPGSG